MEQRTFVGTIALLFSNYESSFSSPDLGLMILILSGFLAFLIGVPAVYGYAAVAMIIGARRTADRVLKAHIRFLGLALAAFALELLLSLTIAGPASSSSLSTLPGNLAGILAAYLVYRSVMSLSPIGHAEKDDVTSPESGERVATSGQKAGV